MLRVQVDNPIPKEHYWHWGKIYEGIVRFAYICLAVGLNAIFSLAQAQSTSDEVASIVRERNKERGVLALGDDAFGEQISHIDGSLSFYQMDRMIKGNGPEIVLARSWSHADRRYIDTRTDLPFGNWDLVLPKVEEQFYEPVLYGWDGKGEALFQRSANYAKVPPIFPSGASSYQRLTLSGWAVGDLKNQSGSKIGYFAVSPSGDKYWLDRKHVYYGNDFNPDMGRYFPTRVEDRFGNFLVFTWAGSQLQQIDASDGRSVKLNWSSGRISSVVIPAGGGQTWNYLYTNTAAPDLIRVTNPEHTYWEYSLSAFEKICIPTYIDHPNGNLCYDFSTGQWPPIVGTIRHPSGLVGTFKIQGRLLKSQISAIDPVGGAWQNYGFVPIVALPVRERKYVGVGIDQVWSYHYGEQCPSGASVDNPGKFETRLPDGSLTVVLFENTWKGAHYGEVVESLVGASCMGSGVYSAPRRVKNEWVATGESVPWVNPRGTSSNPMLGVYQKGFVFPVRRTIVLQDGARFVAENEIFDSEARPIRIKRSSEPQ